MFYSLIYGCFLKIYSFCAIFQTDLRDIGQGWLPEDINRGKAEYVSQESLKLIVCSSLGGFRFWFLLAHLSRRLTR